MDAETPSDSPGAMNRKSPSNGKSFGNSLPESAAATFPALGATPISITKTIFSGWALWASLGLIAINLLVYSPVANHHFVNYDDPTYVQTEPHVLRGITWNGLAWALTTGYFGNWHPLTWLSHMMDVQLYGLNPSGHHLSSLFLHIANTVLLFGLLHAITGRLGRSAFAAALFAVHPLHVESVAWVSERKDVLSALLGLLTIWAYAGYARQPRPRRYAAVFVLFALGLMAKPMLVTLPFLLLLLDFWPLGRFRLPPASASVGRNAAVPEKSGEEVANVRRLLLEKLPLLALAIASSAVTLAVQSGSGAVRGYIPLKLRAENAVVSYAAYIGKFLWPSRLAPFYPYPQSIPLWRVAACAAILTALTVAAIRAARRRPYLTVGWFWFVVALAPVIGLIQTGGQAMADRYMYLPLVGLAIAVAWGVPEAFARRPAGARALRAALPVALPLLAGLAIAACMIAARAQVYYWRDSVTLWERTLQVTSGNGVAEANLGIALAEQGKTNEAIARYAAALQVMPDFAEAHNGLGAALMRQGRIDQAIAQFAAAVRSNPGMPQAHDNLGQALASQGRLDAAIAQFSEAVRLDPNRAGTHGNLGIALASQGRMNDAAAQLREALRLDPDLAQAHNALGIVFASEGKIDDAAAQFSEALRIDPAYGEAHGNLGIALASRGKSAEALRELSEALRLNPNNPQARKAMEDLRNRSAEPVGR